MSEAPPPAIPIAAAVLTISDSRTLADDRSGAIAAAALTDAGHRVVARALVADTIPAIRGQLAAWIEDPTIDVIITTGGTGVTPRDVTPEALAPLITKPIPGFGELFRWLSYAEIGTSTVQSRAEAALCDQTYVFLLPGSPGAVRMAFDKILRQQLDSRHRPCNFVELLPRIRGQARG